MKKLLLLSLFAVAVATTSVSAQTGTPKLSLGAEFGLPVGTFGDATDVGFGGSLSYQHPVADKLYLTASAGYLTFTGKSIFGPSISYNFDFVPVKAGMKYFIANNFYGSAELGASFATGSASGTAFAYSPGLGVEFPVSAKGSVDLGARYEGWSGNKTGNMTGTLSFIGIRAAFNFGL